MIVVAGEALVDLVIGVDGTVVAKLGGGPYNVARTIGRLDRPVSFLGSISNDRFGSQLFAHLLADGVSADATTRTDLPTTLAAAELDDSGAATYRFYITDTSAPALVEVPQAAASPRAVHAGTLGLVLEPMASTVAGYLAQLPAATLVMLDPNCRTRVVPERAAYLRRLDQCMALSHIVKISTDDAEYMAPGVDPEEYARKLVHGGVAVVLLTAGGDGAWAVTPQRATLVPVQPITVADTIGAGDSFGGSFLAWWLDRGYGVGELADHDAVVAAVEAAQEVAAFTCSQVGAEPPRRAQLSARWQPA